MGNGLKIPESDELWSRPDGEDHRVLKLPIPTRITALVFPPRRHENGCRWQVLQEDGPRPLAAGLARGWDLAEDAALAAALGHLTRQEREELEEVARLVAALSPAAILRQALSRWAEAIERRWRKKRRALMLELPFTTITTDVDAELNLDRNGDGYFWRVQSDRRLVGAGHAPTVERAKAALLGAVLLFLPLKERAALAAELEIETTSLQLPARRAGSAR